MGIISDGLICVTAVSQIFQLHQAIKIFNNCAVGLYSSMPFLNPHCKNSCPWVGWISSCLEQPHLSCCFVLLQAGWNSSENSWILIKAFGQSHNVSNKSKQTGHLLFQCPLIVPYVLFEMGESLLWIEYFGREIKIASRPLR